MDSDSDSEVESILKNTTILDLNDKLLEDVLSNLTFTELCVVRPVCKRFEKIAEKIFSEGIATTVDLFTEYLLCAEGESDENDGVYRIVAAASDDQKETILTLVHGNKLLFDLLEALLKLTKMKCCLTRLAKVFDATYNTLYEIEFCRHNPELLIPEKIEEFQEALEHQISIVSEFIDGHKHPRVWCYSSEESEEERYTEMENLDKELKRIYSLVNQNKIRMMGLENTVQSLKSECHCTKMKLEDMGNKLKEMERKAIEMRDQRLRFLETYGDLFNQPLVQEPAERPAIEEPAHSEPVIEEPVDEEPLIEEPEDDEPLIEESVAEESIAEGVVSEESFAESAVSEEPVIEGSIIEDSSIEAPVIQEPATGEPIVEQPAFEETMVEEHVVEEPEIEDILIPRSVRDEVFAVINGRSSTMSCNPPAKKPKLVSTPAKEKKYVHLR